MTEEQWPACTDPQMMLAFLRDAGMLSERQARLFGCACCRRVWRLLTDERSRRAVEVAERHADGLADEDQLFEAWDTARVPLGFVARATVWATWPTGRGFGAPANAALDVCNEVSGCSGSGCDQGDVAARPAESAEHAALLRDIFGPLPFRQVHIDPAWLTWNGGAVTKLAEAAYAERSLPAGTLESHRLAVLADALEEAGCTEPEILGHCRQQERNHVRGCWVVDLLLGRA